MKLPVWQLFVTAILISFCSPQFSLAQEKAPAEKKAKPDVKGFEEKVKKQIEQRIVKEAKEKAENQALPSGVHVIVEFIEVEAMDFSDWLLENPLTSDATDLRKEVQVWVKAGNGKIIETMVVAARSGQRAKTEAIKEWIYPTEYDPPVPATIEAAGDKDYAEMIPANPTAFETRNVGFTLEVDPVIGNDGTIDLNLAPEVVIADEPSLHTTKLGDTESTVEMPRFMASKVTTQVSIRNGDYAFLGTSRLGITKLGDAKDPILLMFVRCDATGIE